MATVRSMVEARRIIWHRICTTIINDLDIGDWMLDDFGNDEPSQRRLIKATKQIAKTIKRRLAKRQTPSIGESHGVK